MCVYVYTYIYIYIYTHTYAMCVCVSASYLVYVYRLTSDAILQLVQLPSTTSSSNSPHLETSVEPRHPSFEGCRAYRVH